MFKKVFRIVVVFCGMLFGYGVAEFLIREIAPQKGYTFTNTELVLFQSVVIFIFALIFFKLFNALYRSGERMARSLESSIEGMPVQETVPGVLGLISGLIIAFLLSRIINDIRLLQTFYLDTIISIILYVVLGSIGYTVAKNLSQSGALRNGLSGVMQSAGGGKGRGRSKGPLPKIFDTSVIIDGRIHELMSTGFLEGDVIIPDVVLVELRHLADSSDSLKRARGRRGLDILNAIQSDYGIEIYNTEGDKSLAEIPEVDVKLIKLAQLMKGVIVTNDFNLNKVASITGVGVLNVNELANTQKPVVLPGEEMQVFVVKEGKERTQGVGYLDDGTMIVVEEGRACIGKTVETVVTSVLQTAAGRMIFTKVK